LESLNLISLIAKVLVWLGLHCAFSNEASSQAIQFRGLQVSHVQPKNSFHIHLDNLGSSQ